jgi:hypothetical protein
LVKRVCSQSGFVVTRPDSPVSCQKYLSFK